MYSARHTYCSPCCKHSIHTRPRLRLDKNCDALKSATIDHAKSIAILCRTPSHANNGVEREPHFPVLVDQHTALKLPPASRSVRLTEPVAESLHGVHLAERERARGVPVRIIECVCVCACGCACAHTRTHISLRTCASSCVSAHVRAWMHVHVHARMRVCTCAHACVCALE